MQAESAAPGMQYSKEAQLSGQKAGLGGNLLEGGGTFIEEQIEEQRGVKKGEDAERFGDREGDQEVRHRQKPVELALKPDLGVSAAAPGARAVVAAMETEDLLPAGRARTAVPAHRRGATPQEGGECPALGGWEAGTVAGEVVGPVVAQEVTQGGHYAPSRGRTSELIAAKALSSLTAVR